MEKYTPIERADPVYFEKKKFSIVKTQRCWKKKLSEKKPINRVYLIWAVLRANSTKAQVELQKGRLSTYKNNTAVHFFLQA